MSEKKFFEAVLVTAPILLLLLFVESAHGNPVDLAPSNTELKDLTASAKNNQPGSLTEKLQISDPFSHRDEDQLKGEAINLSSDQSLRYDVEVLDVQNTRKENVELEERFRGPAIRVNTNTFTAENIETLSGEDSVPKLPENHMLVTTLLVVFGLFSIGVYAALVIWRMRLEHRYGMRELLVSTEDDYPPPPRSSH